MYKYLVCNKMHRNAAVLTILCILLCLTFNYTFPLHREGSKWFMDSNGNHSRFCGRSVLNTRDNIVDRTKKMGTNLENALRKFRDSTQDITRNIQAKNALSEEDLRQYEQLVIMKKYPYLDLKEIDKYSPSEKNIRQSGKYDSGTNNDAGEPSFCEPLDMPNVEITNRGLSGFAIPAKIVKTTKLLDNTLKLNNIKDPDNSVLKQNIQLAVTPPPRVLESLHDDIVYYEEKKFK